MSLEQGNQLLEAGADANDKIRDANLKTTQLYHNEKKGDTQKADEADWYHGVTDVLGGHGAYKALSQNSARMAGKNLKGISGFGRLALSDTKQAGVKLGGAAADLAEGTVNNVKGIANTISSGYESLRGDTSGQSFKGRSPSISAEEPAFNGNVPDTVKISGGGGKGVVGDDTVLKTQEITPRPSSGEIPDIGSETFADIPVSGLDSSTKAPSTSTPLADISEGVENKQSTFEKGISSITGTDAGSLARQGLGKSLSNIGGGIDIVKDFDNIGKKGGFFGGTGSSGGDKLSNALTVGGSVLDIASLALPFLAPIAGAVQVAGAIDGSYESIKDSQKTASNTKSNYQADLQKTNVSPSLAGTGFLASQATDSHKLIGGSSSF